MDRTTPHSDVIRQTLVSRAEAYAHVTGCSLSHIGEEAIRDSKFVANVKNGANFTIRTYQRVIDWLDAAECRLKAEGHEGAAERTEVAA